MQGLLANFTGIVSGFVTVGVVLDAVAIDENQKLKLSALFLNTRTSKTSVSELCHQVIDAAYSVVFDRWFGEKFLSLKYLFTSAVISLCFLTCFLTLQLFFHREEFKQIEWTNLQICVLLFAAAFNCVLDWLSFGVTQTLFQLAKASRKISHILFLIGCDIVLSINVFNLIFPIFIAVLSFGLLNAGSSGTLLSSIDYLPKVEDSKNARTVDASEDRDSGHGYSAFYNGLVVIDKPISSQSVVLEITTSNPSLGLKDILVAYGLPSSSFEARKFIRVSECGGLEPRLIDIPFSIDNFQKNKDLFLNQFDRSNPDGCPSAVIREELEFNLRPWSAPTDLNALYTYNFQKVQLLQASFPGSLGLSPIFLDIKENSKSYLLGLLPESLYGCEVKSATFVHWQATESGFDKANGRCSDDFLITRGALGELLAAMLDSSLAKSNLYLPLNSFFATSMLACIFFYLILLSLFFLRFVSAVVVIRASVLEPYVRRAPLTCGFFLVGFCLALITSFTG